MSGRDTTMKRWRNRRFWGSAGSLPSASVAPPPWLSLAMVYGLLLFDWCGEGIGRRVTLVEAATVTDQSGAIRINCGGRGYRDNRGRVWADDSGFEWSTAPSVAATVPAGVLYVQSSGADDPDAVYGSFRVFDLSNDSNAGYRFFVESSRYYLVRLRFTLFYYAAADTAPFSSSGAAGGGNGGDDRMISLPSFGIAVEGVPVADVLVTGEQAMAIAAGGGGGVSGNDSWIPIDKEFVIYMQNRGLKLSFLSLTSLSSSSSSSASPPVPSAASPGGGKRSVAQISAIEIVPIPDSVVAAHMDFKMNFPSAILRLEKRINCGGDDVADTGTEVFAWRSDSGRFSPQTSEAENTTSLPLALPSSSLEKDAGYMPQAVRSTRRVLGGPGGTGAVEALQYDLAMEYTEVDVSGYCLHTYHDLSATDLSQVREGVRKMPVSWIQLAKVDASGGTETFLTILTEYRLHDGAEGLMLQTRHCFAGVHVEVKSISRVRVTFQPSDELGNITRRPNVNAIVVYALLPIHNSSTKARSFQNVTEGFGLPFTHIDPCLDPQIYFVKCGLDQKEGSLAIRSFNLSSQGLKGTIPPELGAFNHLEQLYLGWNELVGPIPNVIGEDLLELSILDLRNNSLNGSISPSLSHLPALRSLFLDNNDFSGAIPRHFFEIDGLNFTFAGNDDLCNPYTDPRCNDTSPPWPGDWGRGGGPRNENPEDSSPSAPVPRAAPNTSGVGWKVVLAVVAAVVVSTLGCCLVVLFLQRGNVFTVHHARHSRLDKRHDGQRFSPTRVGMSEALIMPAFGGHPSTQLVAAPLLPPRLPAAGAVASRAAGGGLSYQLFSEEDLVVITMEYRMKIGKGGFGNVYKGFFPPQSGEAVAVKVATMASSQNADEFQKEIGILSRLYHRHLVRLIGCCSDGGTRAIVYQFIPNGSLHDYLHGSAIEAAEENGAGATGDGGRASRPNLDWSHRLRILIGTARALDYIHTQVHPPVIHRDVKSSNILLDDDYEAKLTDFGISVEMASTEKTHVTAEVVQGTSGYVDPEYCDSRKVSDRVDVYSFGVVLLEVITGKEPKSKYMSAECDLVTKARNAVSSVDEVLKMVDPRLSQGASSGAYKAEVLLEVVRLAVWCCQRSSKERPPIGAVCHTLQDIFESEGGQVGGGGETRTTRNGLGGKGLPGMGIRGDVVLAA